MRLDGRQADLQATQGMGHPLRCSAALTRLLFVPFPLGLARLCFALGLFLGQPLLFRLRE